MRLVIQRVVRGAVAVGGQTIGVVVQPLRGEVVAHEDMQHRLDQVMLC